MVLSTAQRIRQLTDQRGVAGDEQEIRTYLLSELKNTKAEVRVDRMGNILAELPGTESDRCVLLTAHMDEVGFIILGAQDDGLLRYAPIGIIDPRVVVAKGVLIGKDRVPGVLSSKPIHLQEPGDRKKVQKHDEFRIDIGASDKAGAEKLVTPGDTAIFDAPFMEFGDGCVRARALDDRVGCLSLLRILEAGPYPVRIICAFTTMEEAISGSVGVRAVGFETDPDLAINLEGTAANDLGDVPEHLRVCIPGKGAAVSFMDHSAIAYRSLYRAIMEAGTRAGVPWQIKEGVTGSNDAGYIQRSKGGYPVCVVSVPCRSIHSGAPVCKISDIDAQFHLIEAYLREGAPLNGAGR